MPISSSAATLEKKKLFKQHHHAKSIEQNDRQPEKSLLKIASALPAKDKHCLFIRSHSTLNASAITKVQQNVPAFSDSVNVRTHSDGSLHVSRLQEEKEIHPDRISLDRRSLVSVPIINGEHKLRLLSLQHNLVSNLETLGNQSFPTLVFLDLYDNQLERIHCLGKLENLRVLLMGKNRNDLEDLELICQTDLKCVWSKQKHTTREKYRAVPIKDMPCFKKKVNKHVNIIADDEEMLNFFIRKLPNSAISKHRIKSIEGLETLLKLEVLDLHGNQISQVDGLNDSTELKVLNLAGNQLRIINSQDFRGLTSLQELNLRRNRLRKLLGFAEVPSLMKLFISNNDLHCIEDISSLAKSPNIKEITIDNNPVSLEGECIFFLVSYLPLLTKLNTMQITEQVRKSAMAWRRNKETTDLTFTNLASDVSLNCRREEVISNARVNWELLRTQTKYLTNTGGSTVEKSLKNLKPDADFFLTALPKSTGLGGGKAAAFKSKISRMSKAPVLPDKKITLPRTPSQETDNSQNTSNSSAGGGSELFKLPPILVPIINRLEEQIMDDRSKDGCGGTRLSAGGSSSSVGMNVNSSIASGSELDVADSLSFCSSNESDSETDSSSERSDKKDAAKEVPRSNLLKTIDIDDVATRNLSLDASSVLSTSTTSTSTNLSNPSSSNDNNNSNNNGRKSAVPRTRSALQGGRVIGVGAVHRGGSAARASTAKVKKMSSPALPKDREQGGDYLIEICGRHLNVYGQGALRFIDKPWNASKAHDVNTVKFNYVNFNSVAGVLGKIRHRFPNVDHFAFKETNISYLGQLNAIAEVQGLTTLVVDAEGNPICEKEWESYAIYRLSHWGLKFINEREITESDVKLANEEYDGLSELVLWSLPEILLQPLLVRLRIDINHGVSEDNAKKWLLSADPQLRKVVSKETLQWKKTTLSQEEAAMRQKAKHYIASLLDETANAMNKLTILERDWPKIFYDFTQNTLLDYSQLDIYMKQNIQEL